MNYNQLDRDELIFLVNELNNRSNRIKDSLKKYHDSEKGRDKRLEAQKRYYYKKSSSLGKVSCCGKLISPLSMERHLTSKLHLKNTSNPSISN